MKLYVIVRSDLSFPQKAVQAGHGVAEWILDNPQVTDWNKTLVYLTADDIYGIKDRLEMRGINFSSFYEPDIGNELTSLACLGSNSIVKKLKLLT